MEDWSNVKKVYRKGVEVYAVYEKGEKVWPLGPVEIKDYFYIENISNTVCDVTLTKTGSAPEINLEKSTNGVSWESVDTTQSTIATIPVGEKIYFRGINDRFASDLFDYNSITGTQTYNVGGNIMSLLYGSDFEDEKTLTIYSCFVGILEGGTTLIDASNLRLPATTIGYYCYSRMFYNCTSLTTAPALPATKLESYCYYRMFYNCTSLTTAPALPATKLESDCYRDMFYGCKSLTTAPELPATTLKSSCYRSMFYGCTSLTQAPSVLPATTLANYCYDYMFCNCKSLTTAPELPATTLVYQCYYYMFNGCTKLNYVKHNVVDWNTFHTTYWLNGVSSTGTMVCPADSTIPTNNVNGCPTGWTKQSIVGKTWVTKDWGTNIPEYGKNIWGYGDKLYCSDGTKDLKLVSGKFENTTRTLIPEGYYVWEADHLYMSSSYRAGFILLGSGDGEFQRITSYPQYYIPIGNDVWTDSYGKAYFSNGNSQWEVIGLHDGLELWVDTITKFTTNRPEHGRNIWKDNSGNIYYSEESKQYIYNGNSFDVINWGGNYPLYGEHVWKDSENNIYYSYESTQLQLVNGSWVSVDWGENKPIHGYNVWTDNSGNTYYSDNTYQYQLINK